MVQRSGRKYPVHFAARRLDEVDWGSAACYPERSEGPMQSADNAKHADDSIGADRKCAGIRMTRLS